MVLVFEGVVSLFYKDTVSSPGNYVTRTARARKLVSASWRVCWNSDYVIAASLFLPIYKYLITVPDYVYVLLTNFDHIS